MCGIAGVYGEDLSKDSRRNEIQQMISSLQHRGPDGWGYYISPEIALGHARLSIVDLATGDQPFATDKYVISFNGEIYNFIEIRQELEKRGIRFKSTSDTEVLLRAYEYYGESCFEKLNGQFAVLIWSKVEKELLIARDRFGIRPLYILNHKERFYFASELKAFDTIEGYSREFDIKRLYEHALLWNTYGDHTIYKQIRSLQGGTYAKYENGKLILEKKYYELGNNNSYDKRSFQQAEEEFNYLLEDSVKLRLRSDVPVGAYLSGGIDSSVITHLVKENTEKKFKTFSIAFDDAEYDESTYQREMVDQIKSDHYTLNINNKQIDAAFPDAIYHTERPVFRTAAVPLYLLSQKVKENDIKVVLTGEGADEILWGYDSFKEVKMLEFWSKFPDSSIRPQLIKKLYPHLSHYRDERQYGMMKMFYEGFLGDFDNKLASVNIRIHNNKILKNYFNRDHNLSYEKDSMIKEMDSFFPEKYTSWSLLQQNQFMEMNTLLSGYLLSSQGDRMSLANGVEGRYPFLDHRIIDSLFSVNEKFKLNGFSQKYLLTQSFKNKIPKSILNRPKRPYMSPDLKSFFVNGKPTENVAFFLSDDLINEYKIFDLRFVQRFMKKFSTGVPQNIGYRDNMIISFIVSTQIANYWMKNPKKYVLSEDLLKIKIVDY
ncbi:asparagine synthase (glutamine-hydrolyzing) [Labilibaculum antarcticum]|uniref:asparagine synthase (glutamine-hydrolyzing) n=1 Tax=Labilibaculum antarcticum TaxID=1717717 RepID=A0A1Y1CTM4_9BACT|nr:asparagine synthase (glutamine-hydrolyzing) [Labilibaculum antarcticum]BAX82621.1 asparagine synthetase B [Labilibaculum antarcticum]